MERTTRILALTLALFCATPSHPISISNRTWYGLTGLGAIGGAVIGTVCYKAYAGENTSPNQDQSDKKKKKETRLEAFKRMLPTFGAAAIGAAITGFGIRRFLWCWTPGAEELRVQAQIAQEQAQQQAAEHARVGAEQAHLLAAQNNLLLAQDTVQQTNARYHVIDFINAGLDGRTIEDRANTHFQRYPLVYAAQAMHNAQLGFQNARNTCQNALANANGNEQLILQCNDTRAELEQLIAAVQEFARDIQALPGYQLQVVAEGVERIAAQHSVQLETEKFKLHRMLLMLPSGKQMPIGSERMLPQI